MDIERRAHGIAEDVRLNECDPEHIKEESDELVAVVKFSLARKSVEEAA